MNHLKNLHQIKNRYYAMRHAQSKANLQQIIVSHPIHGTHEDYALTDLGKQQASTSAVNCPLTEETIIYTSDFSRAKETAKIVQEVLKVPEVHVTELLRERNFGGWEKTHHDNYHKVWKDDEGDADHKENGVESINSVLERVTSLILELEKKYEDQDILLVSHGDTLQILQTGFQKINPSQHRTLQHLETAEVRQLEISSKVMTGRDRDE